jgi:hypothetical protein
MATSTDDFFRSRLDQMIDLRHPLAVLASRMPWQEIESSLAHRFARAAKAGKQIEDIDLFGATVSLSGGGISKAGRPRLPLRLMVSLLYLKHAFNESDEALVERWGETPTWQKHRGRFKSLTDEERKNLKRRQAIEPIIGHLKADHRMNRCHLKGAQGDSLHAVLCAAGYNIRWLLRMIAKKGVPFLQTLFLRLLEHSGLAEMGRWAERKIAKFGGEVPGRRRLDASVYLALG